MKSTLEIPATFDITYYDDNELEWHAIIDDATVVIDVWFETPEDLMETTKTLIKAFSRTIEFTEPTEE